MNITSARIANETGDAVELLTDDQGAVMVCLPPHSENIVGGQAAYSAWIEQGNTPAPYVQLAVNSIAAGEQCIEDAGFTASRMVTMFDELLEAKSDGSISSRPKLTAVYTWMKTVKAMAKAGAIEFPPAPFTFEEVVTE